MNNKDYTLLIIAAIALCSAIIIRSIAPEGFIYPNKPIIPHVISNSDFPKKKANPYSLLPFRPEEEARPEPINRCIS